MKNLVHFYFLFFQFPEIVDFLGLIQAYFRVLRGHTTLYNAPMEKSYSVYVWVWVWETYRAFILDFKVICDFSPADSHLSSFSVTLGSLWPTF